MGSILTAIRDDYDDYTYLCKCLEIDAISIRNEKPTFYEHQRELLKKVNCSSVYEYIKKYVVK